MIYIILAIVIIFCFAIIVFLVSKKTSKLKLIAVGEIPEEKQSEVKKQLLELRLQKRLASLGRRVINLLVAGVKIFKKAIPAMVGAIKGRKMRDSLKIKKEEIKIKREMKPTSNMDVKLSEANELFKKRKYEEAEEKYIAVLKDDPKNIDVYMALGEIYANNKDWPTAEETYRHVMRINPEFLPAQKELAGLLEATKKWEELKQLSQYIIKGGEETAWIYVKLGLSYRKTGYPDVAEEYFLRAVELEPKNGVALDYLIEAAIINKNKPLALKAFNTLLGISNDAIKLQSFKDKIDIL